MEGKRISIDVKKCEDAVLRPWTTLWNRLLLVDCGM